MRIFHNLIFLFIVFCIVLTADRAYSIGNPASVSLIKNNIDGSQTLIGHIPLEVRNATAVLKYHALSSQNINIKIILPLQNQTQLSTLIQALYNPQNPNFHHFLTPAQFVQQFGPSSIDAQEITAFLHKEGISVVGAPNGVVLNAVGSVSAIEKVFRLQINYYQKPDGTIFFAPDGDPTIPAELAGKVLAIGGLDNLAKYHPHLIKASLKASVRAALTGSGPGGYLAPSDIKTAYNLNSIASNGVGQNIALFELAGYLGSDIKAYDANFGLTGVPLQNILVDGFNGQTDYGDGAAEVTLDIELLTAFAPGSNGILVYEDNNTTQSWIDEWTRIAFDDTAKVISCSWGVSEYDISTVSFDNAIFQQMATQGQSVFVATGDRGAYDDGNTLSVDEPAAQPYVTGVGISALSTNTNGRYNNEKASLYGGGGISAYQTIPYYQTTAASQAVSAAKVSTTMRNVPDVVLTADPSTSHAFYIFGAWAGYAGSGLAAPIWAAFMADVNQGLGQNAPLGFANPVLYQIAQMGRYATDFHDINLGNNGYYPAESGFDDATGLGSFNGLNLYNDLVSQGSAGCRTSADCTPGLTCCNGTCSVTNFDYNNCGACGNSCTADQICIYGSCRCPDSGSGQIVCGNACTSIYADSNNCGACGHVCPAGETCQAGNCR